jgi:hypothetical protein
VAIDEPYLPPHVHDPTQEVDIADGNPEQLTLTLSAPGAQEHHRPVTRRHLRRHRLDLCQTPWHGFGHLHTGTDDEEVHLPVVDHVAASRKPAPDVIGEQEQEQKILREEHGPHSSQAPQGSDALSTKTATPGRRVDQGRNCSVMTRKG